MPLFHHDFVLMNIERRKRREKKKRKEKRRIEMEQKTV